MVFIGSIHTESILLIPNVDPLKPFFFSHVLDKRSFQIFLYIFYFILSKTISLNKSKADCNKANWLYCEYANNWRLTVHLYSLTFFLSHPSSCLVFLSLLLLETVKYMVLQLCVFLFCTATKTTDNRHFEHFINKLIRYNISGMFKFLCMSTFFKHIIKKNKITAFFFYHEKFFYVYICVWKIQKFTNNFEKKLFFHFTK